MKLILQKDIKNLGKTGDQVLVKKGYARNFLIPNKLALPINKGRLKALKHQDILITAKKRKALSERKKLVEKLSALNIEFEKESLKDGKLFGSVTAFEISQTLEKNHNIHVDKRDISPITLKTVGEHKVTVCLDSEHKSEMTIHIKGKSVKKREESSKTQKPLDPSQVEALESGDTDSGATQAEALETGDTDSGATQAEALESGSTDSGTAQSENLETVTETSNKELDTQEFSKQLEDSETNSVKTTRSDSKLSKKDQSPRTTKRKEEKTAKEESKKQERLGRSKTEETLKTKDKKLNLKKVSEKQTKIQEDSTVKATHKKSENQNSTKEETHKKISSKEKPAEISKNKVEEDSKQSSTNPKKEKKKNLFSFWKK